MTSVLRFLDLPWDEAVLRCEVRNINILRTVVWVTRSCSCQYLHTCTLHQGIWGHTLAGADIAEDRYLRVVMNYGEIFATTES